MKVGTFEEFDMGLNPSESQESNIDTKVIQDLVDLVGSEEDVETAAKEAFEELKMAFDDNNIELTGKDAPESLVISALVIKLVENGKLGPQEADSFIEDQLSDEDIDDSEE